MDKTILLLQIGNRYVPIVETAVKMVDLEAEAAAEAAEAIAATAAANETNEKDQILNNEESENNGENVEEKSDPLNATSGPQSLNLTSARRQSSENNQENKSLTEESFPLQPLWCHYYQEFILFSLNENLVKYM